MVKSVCQACLYSAKWTAWNKWQCGRCRQEGPSGPKEQLPALSINSQKDTSSNEMQVCLYDQGQIALSICESLV